MRVPVVQGRRTLYTVTGGKGGLSGLSGTEWPRNSFFYSRIPLFPRERACGTGGGVYDAANGQGGESGPGFVVVGASTRIWVPVMSRIGAGR